MRTYYPILLGLSFVFWQCSGSETADKTSDPSPSAVAVSQQAPIKNSFQTLAAQPESQARQISITGRIQALEKLQLVAEVQGKALASTKRLNEGTRYKRGELMLSVEDTQFQLNLKAQKSQFHAALVRIMSQIQLDYPQAHPAWDEYLRLFDENQLIPALPTLEDDQLRFFLSANNILATYYTIKSTEELLPKYTIKAPFTGIVTQGSVVAGAVITPGVPLAQYSRTDVFELKASISSADIRKLSVGQKLPLSHTNTGDNWQGTVHRFGGTIDPATQAVPVFIRVGGKGLREGMFLEANLTADAFEGVVILPIDALNRDNQVHYIDDTTVKLKEVLPVHYHKDEVWVQGLEAGEQVIIEKILGPIVGVTAVSKS